MTTRRIYTRVPNQARPNIPTPISMLPRPPLAPRPALQSIAPPRRPAPTPTKAPTTARRVAPTAPVTIDTTARIVEMPPEAKPLTDIINKAKYQPRPARKGEYLHVSDLIGKCIRKYAIMERQDIDRTPQRLDISSLLTFGVGDTIHDIVKARAVHGSPQQVWGKWRCNCKATKIETPCTLAMPPSTCPVCAGPVDIYEEVPMRDEEHKVVGTPDLILFLQEFQAFYVSELKSIKHDEWKDMTRPLSDHIIQVLFYWYLMRALGYRLMDQVSIMYITKGHVMFGSPVKEFTFVPSTEVHRLAVYLEEAKQFKEARENGVLPTRTMCKAETSSEAKKCEVCSICFGGIDAAPKKISIASALGR